MPAHSRWYDAGQKSHNSSMPPSPQDKHSASLDQFDCMGFLINEQVNSKHENEVMK